MEHLVSAEALWAPAAGAWTSQRDEETSDTFEFADGRVVERYSRPQRIGGKIADASASFRDVTDRKLLEDELAYRAFHDSLTRLANKALFQDRLEHALTRMTRNRLPPRRPLPRPRRLQDRQRQPGPWRGRPAADRRVAIDPRRRPASARTRPPASAATSSPCSSRTCPRHEAVTALAQRILDSLRQPIRLGTKTLSAAGSVGIAFDEAGITSEQLLRNADIAMYQAKKRGKDRFEVYREDMHRVRAGAHRVRGGPAGRHLRAVELVAHYQPIIDLSERARSSASRRWCAGRTRSDGLVDPRHFVRVRQETRPHWRDRLVHPRVGLPSGPRVAGDGRVRPRGLEIERQPLGRPLVDPMLPTASPPPSTDAASTRPRSCSRSRRARR